MVTLRQKQKQHAREATRDCQQQLLLVEDKEESVVIKEPVVEEETKKTEISIPEPEKPKEETPPIPPIEEKERLTPPFPEEKIEQKETICENCKKTYTFASNDYHPGIICPHCNHGQSNPNLKGRTYY